MRVLLGTRGLSSSWLPDHEHMSNMVRHILSTDAVLGLTDVQRHGLDTESKHVLEALNEYQVTLAEMASSDSGYDLIHPSGSSFESTVGTKAWAAKAAEKGKAQTPSESGREVFERVFRKLVTASEAFEYVDSRFFQHLETPNSPAFQFLKLLLSTNVKQIIIYTLKKDKITNEYLNAVDRNLKKLISESKSQSTLKVQIYNENNSFPHDRIGAMRFTNRSLPFYIGYGDQIFDGRDNKKFNTLGKAIFDFDEVKHHVRGIGKIDTLPHGN